MATAECLLLDNTWFDDGRLFASRRPSARRLLHQTRCNLHREVHRSLYRSCVHLKGHGGVKGALRRIMRQQRNHRYVARFDVARLDATGELLASNELPAAVAVDGVVSHMHSIGTAVMGVLPSRIVAEIAIPRLGVAVVHGPAPPMLASLIRSGGVHGPAVVE